MKNRDDSRRYKKPLPREHFIVLFTVPRHHQYLLERLFISAGAYVMKIKRQAM